MASSNNRDNKNRKYLMLDSRGDAIARGLLERVTDGELWRLRVTEGSADEVMGHNNISLVGDTENSPALEGRIVRREGDVVFVEPVRQLEESVRQNLRIPVRFVTYLYAVSGDWKGRVPIVTNDLSCGGLAFFCPRKLEVGEIVQVVITVTSQPLVLTMRVLHTRPGHTEGDFYAGAFVDLVREEESMVREAVFSIQLQKNGAACGGGRCRCCWRL